MALSANHGGISLIATPLESPEGRSYVFISYSSLDWEQAERLYDDLRNVGLSPWLDTKSGDRRIGNVDALASVMEIQQHRIYLNVGQVHGIKNGDKFAIYPPGFTGVEQADRRLAIAEIGESEATKSWARIISQSTKGRVQEGSQAMRLDPYPGDQIIAEMQKVNSGSISVVPLLSSRSGAPYQREIQEPIHYAREIPDMNLIPVRLDDCEIQGELKEFPYVDLFPEDEWKNGIERIVEIIKRNRKASTLDDGRNEKQVRENTANKVEKSFDSELDEKRPEETSVPIELSTSVAAVVRYFSKEKMVRSASIVHRLAHEHPDYANGRLKKLLKIKDISLGDAKPMSTWVSEVRSLYEVSFVTLLNGRLFILGLYLIDSDLRKPLYWIISDLNKEVEKNFNKGLRSLLSHKGLELWDMLFRSERDSVPTWGDFPTKIDELGRKAFAKALVSRLEWVREQNEIREPQKSRALTFLSHIHRRWGSRKSSTEEQKSPNGAFLLHIHGPWGSGKSSVLQLMRAELEDRKKLPSHWNVIEFNAWQHQRIGIPWWSLMDSVYKQAVRNLQKNCLWHSLALRAREHWWRLRVGHSILLWIPATVFGVLGFIFLASFYGIIPVSTSSDYGVTALISLVVSFLSGIQALRSSLVPGSERAAKQFAELKSEPTRRLSNHFNDLIKWVHQPVAIFIDDLDRCTSGYTVDFLEGIQTMFREANVVYVIAADRRWIHTSYQQSYQVFVNTVFEPSRELGEIFLDKIFQMSVSIPHISPETQKQYWERLLYDIPLADEKSIDQIREETHARVKQFRTEPEMLNEVKRQEENKEIKPIYRQVLRETVAERLSSPEVQQHTAHTLIEFYPLLELNPRAMKRFINAYGMTRTIDLLSGKEIVEPKKLALWTVVRMRWPSLADYLENNDDKIQYIGANNDVLKEHVDSGFHDMFNDVNIRRVIRGEGIGVSMDKSTLRKLTGESMKKKGKLNRANRKAVK